MPEWAQGCAGCMIKLDREREEEREEKSKASVW